MVVPLIKPNSTASFCPNNPVRGPCGPVGRIHPAMVNDERLSNSEAGPATKSSTPSNCAAVLSGSNPSNGGERGPATPSVTPFWQVPFAEAPSVPELVATAPLVSPKRQYATGCD